MAVRDLGSNPNITIRVYHRKEKLMDKNYLEELKEIEKKLTELKTKKQKILDEEKKNKENEKKRRYNEVEEAYAEFIDLLEAYENDFNEGFCVKISGEFLEN